jgi:hypothetical protein
MFKNSGPVFRGETLAYDVHVSRTKAQTEVELPTMEAKKGVPMTAGGHHLNGSIQVGREQIKSTLTPELPELEEVAQQMPQVEIWIRIVFGSWIRIRNRIGVKSRIRIQICIKFKIRKL